MQFHSFGAAVAFLLFCPLLRAAPPAATSPLKQLTTAQLTQQANSIIANQDNVQARANVDVIFELADRLADAGQAEEAGKYYAVALRLQPFDFGRHMRYAQVLESQQHHDQAARQEEIVLRGAEDKTLVDKARSMLGRPAVQLTEIKSAAFAEGQPTLVLIPMGDVDLLLMQEEQQQLQKTLGIRVVLGAVRMDIPAARRTLAHPLAEQLRAQFAQIQQQSPQGFADILAKAKLSAEDLKNDHNAFQLASIMLGQQSQEKADAFEQQVASLTAMKQWDGIELLADFQKAAQPFARPNVRFLGVTARDIYAKDFNFLFGWRDGDYAIVSYRRFMGDFNQEVPKRARLSDRLYKQLLASAGHIFGLAPCDDPTCPRAYPDSLDEQDAKSDALCTVCRKGFDDAFAKMRSQR